MSDEMMLLADAVIEDSMTAECGHSIECIEVCGDCERCQECCSCCELEYIGQLGSSPFFHIWTCYTHPHNFFHKERLITRCDKAQEDKEQ